jgi:hypothetical protein
MRAWTALLVLAASGAAGAQTFYPDDPLAHEPPPLDASGVLRRKLSEIYAFAENTFWGPGERSRSPAGAVNTLGEPMDGSWYTHRHYFNRMTPEQLALGPDGRTPPAEGPWTVVRAKTEGIMPGFTILDSAGRTYFIKLDPEENPELATAADAVTGRFLHALGYWVPDQYIVYFTRERLVIGKDVNIVDRYLNTTRKMTARDLDDILSRTHIYADGQYRALASRAIPGEGVGPFRFFGTRTDDPNDIVLHENRRDLRGLYVFCAWLEHNDSKANNTYDTLIEENGVRYLRHYLIDFGSTLGSASIGPKSPRTGNEPLFAWTPTLRNIFTAGLYVPGWMRYDYPDDPAVGRFTSATFNPGDWKPEYPNAAFRNRLPDDEFWAAKQVMAFTDEDIRAIVHAGDYSNPAAEAYIARTLAERRDMIGRTFIEKVLPLDNFAVRENRLVFDDLGVKYGLTPSRTLSASWSRFDNATGARTPVQAAGFTLPPGEGEYWVAEIAQEGDARRTVSVYVRKRGNEAEVVGIDRRW